MSRPEPQVLAWLDDFASAVASRDLERGARLFSPEVLAYGTLTSLMQGRADLLDKQWTPVWNATHSFRFTHVDLVVPSGTGVVVAARWASTSEPGTRREGRCTLVLVGEPLLCVHSHFSMTPQDGARL
jgi:ketosteroid isomerase-like protein